MCLFDDVHDANSRTRMRRRFAAMSILLVALSFLPELLHLRPGPDADAFDFLRGLMVGIALVFSIIALRLCAQPPRSNS